MSDTVVAALVAAWAGGISLLVNWLMNVKLRERGEAHEAELARLRSELASSEVRLRGSIARDLAGHESALRVAGEIELKLHTQATESIAQSMQALTGAIEVSTRLCGALRAGKSVEGIPFDSPQLALMHGGVFLPPELDSCYFESLGMVGEAFGDILTARQAEVGARDEILANVASLTGTALTSFRHAAQVWKHSSWARMQRLRGTVVDSGGTSGS
jgi:hypothetical protein